jgi:hypothetical protein
MGKLRVVLVTRPGALLSPGLHAEARRESPSTRMARQGATDNRKICVLWEGHTPDVEGNFP